MKIILCLFLCKDKSVILYVKCQVICRTFILPEEGSMCCKFRIINLFWLSKRFSKGFKSPSLIYIGCFVSVVCYSGAWLGLKVALNSIKYAIYVVSVNKNKKRSKQTPHLFGFDIPMAMNIFFKCLSKPTQLNERYRPLHFSHFCPNAVLILPTMKLCCWRFSLYVWV